MTMTEFALTTLKANNEQNKKNKRVKGLKRYLLDCLVLKRQSHEMLVAHLTIKLIWWLLFEVVRYCKGEKKENR